MKAIVLALSLSNKAVHPDNKMSSDEKGNARGDEFWKIIVFGKIFVDGGWNQPIWPKFAFERIGGLLAYHHNLLREPTSYIFPIAASNSAASVRSDTH